MADVVVICMVDVYAMICMRCSYDTYLLLLLYELARWQTLLPLFSVVYGTTIQLVARYVGRCSCHGGRCEDHQDADDVG